MMKDKLKAAAYTIGLIEIGLKHLPGNYALYREYPDFYKNTCNSNYQFICEINNLLGQQINHLTQQQNLSRSDLEQIRALKESHEKLTSQIALYEIEYSQSNNNINVNNHRDIIDYLTKFTEENIDKISFTPYEKLV